MCNNRGIDLGNYSHSSSSYTSGNWLHVPSRDVVLNCWVVFKIVVVTVGSRILRL